MRELHAGCGRGKNYVPLASAGMDGRQEIYYHSKVLLYQSGNILTSRCFSATIVVSGSIA